MQCAKTSATVKGMKMTIEPREPMVAFDFGQAVGAWFNTPGGRDYALRLWFWHSLSIFIMMIIVMPILLPTMGEYLEAAWIMNRETFSGGQGDPGPMLAAMAKSIPGFLLFMVGMMVTSSMGEAAFYRKYLLGAEPARIPIRLDVHTFRNMLVQLGFYALYAFVYIIGVIAISIVGGLLAAIFAPLGVIVIVLGIIAILIALIAYPVIFAPSAALSALRGKTHILATRKVIKHRFWPLFGAFLVTYVGGYIAYYIVYTIVVIMVTGDPNFMMAMSGLGTENPRALFEATAARFSSPLMMVAGVLGMLAVSIAWSAWMLWIAGVSAYAVRWWQSDEPTSVFD